MNYEILNDNFNINNEDLLVIYNHVIRNPPEKQQVKKLNDYYNLLKIYSLTYNINSNVYFNIDIYLKNNYINDIAILFFDNSKRKIENNNIIYKKFDKIMNKHDLNFIKLYSFYEKAQILPNCLSFDDIINQHKPELLTIDLNKKSNMLHILNDDNLISNCNVDYEYCDEYDEYVHLLTNLLLQNSLQYNKRFWFGKNRDKIKIEFDLDDYNNVLRITSHTIKFQKLKLENKNYSLKFLFTENKDKIQEENFIPFEYRNNFNSIYVYVYLNDDDFLFSCIFHVLSSGKCLFTIHKKNGKEFKEIEFKNKPYLLNLINNFKNIILKDKLTPFINKYEFLKLINNQNKNRLLSW